MFGCLFSRFYILLFTIDISDILNAIFNNLKQTYFKLILLISRGIIWPERYELA